MNKYYLANRGGNIESVYCKNDVDAFAIAQLRNRKEPRANWKAYTVRGDLICGLFQHGERSVITVR